MLEQPFSIPDTIPRNRRTGWPVAGAAWSLAHLDRHRAGYVACARQILRCAALAEDVVQDVLLRLAAEPPPVPASAQAAYAGRMVRNLALDRARRRSFERRVFADLDGAARSAPDGATPESEVAAREALRRVEAALADLPEPARTVFRLHRFEGVPQKAVAAQMGVSRALVCGLVRRGHLHCLAALDGSCGVSRACPARLTAPPGEEEDGTQRIGGEFGDDPARQHAVVAVETRQDQERGDQGESLRRERDRRRPPRRPDRLEQGRGGELQPDRAEGQREGRGGARALRPRRRILGEEARERV
ncbi:hypothetical protein DK427_22195 [Methylobacterium radiodurans]|uniref:RNA polymerase, sigma-24 subunit, ECF subfamily n=1 Tax=Methylobacterium radiodurans TaxID=2202828 RepID=A0A2U8W1M0_9HYPH|nr:hypothetical protein DK427_22195 [Methylobacterium radiodurans]